ncbi:MAG: segregation/condensation protein A [Phycisphaerales bacterium]|nr:segregation/condensation protein A [Phycisphaerales bacterium]
MTEYKIQLDTYSGPLDLLLYLIRREEVEVYDIPIARILEQYLAYTRLLEELNPDLVGDFLVMAATLIEIKSRMLLPKPPPEVEDDDGLDPRADLVRQLLAYRTFREAARQLSDRADQHQRRFARPPVELDNDGEQQLDIEDVQIWDLLTAFNKLLASVGKQKTTHDVIYDDTPITLHAADILDRMEREGPAISFATIFQGRTRGEMVGLFLALLELIRQKRVRVDQPDVSSPIIVHLLDATPITTILESEEESNSEMEDSADSEKEPEPVAIVEAVDDAVFEDEETSDGDSEFHRKIDAVEIAEVDLGWSHERDASDPAIEDEMVEPTDTPEEQPET